jgi:hypothetical protein
MYPDEPVRRESMLWFIIAYQFIDQFPGIHGKGKGNGHPSSPTIVIFPDYLGTVPGRFQTILHPLKGRRAVFSIAIYNLVHSIYAFCLFQHPQCIVPIDTSKEGLVQFPYLFYKGAGQKASVQMKGSPQTQVKSIMEPSGVLRGRHRPAPIPPVGTKDAKASNDEVALVPVRVDTSLKTI